MNTRKNLRRRPCLGETLKRYIYILAHLLQIFELVVSSFYQDTECFFILLYDLITAGSCQLEAEA
jgi:hypothetical protein